MNSLSVLVVGSVAIDDVETPFGKMENSIGGSAIYFSTACSFFTKVRIVGIAGKDFPKEVIERLHARGVDTTGFTIEDGDTFRWGGRYHQDMNSRDTLYTKLGLFEKFNPELPDEYKNTPLVFLGNIQPSLQLQVMNQMKNYKFVACDTMNLWIETAKNELLKLLKKVNMIIINDSELHDLTGEINIIKGLEKVHNMGPEYVIVKKGENGAYLSHNLELFFTPTYPVKQPIDPTGAGDSFAGGFFGYLSTQNTIDFKTLKKAVIYGNVMGSICVEDFNIQALLRADKKTIEDRYNSIRNMLKI